MLGLNNSIGLPRGADRGARGAYFMGELYKAACQYPDPAGVWSVSAGAVLMIVNAEIQPGIVTKVRVMRSMRWLGEGCVNGLAQWLSEAQPHDLYNMS